MLDIRYYTFLKVYETLNYTRAAEELHITQPTVSQHIAYIERNHNVKLFRTSHRQTIALPAADYLYIRTKKLAGMSASVVDKIHEITASEADITKNSVLRKRGAKWRI